MMIIIIMIIIIIILLLLVVAVAVVVLNIITLCFFVCYYDYVLFSELFLNDGSKYIFVRKIYCLR